MPWDPCPTCGVSTLDPMGACMHTDSDADEGEPFIEFSEHWLLCVPTVCLVLMGPGFGVVGLEAVREIGMFGGAVFAIWPLSWWVAWDYYWPRRRSVYLKEVTDGA